MKILKLSIAVAALTLTSTTFAGEGNKPMGEKPQTHGQAVSQTAQSTHDGTAVSTVAQAQRDFKQLDLDKDGFVTQADISTDVQLTAQFADWDDDKDLKLSQAEYDAYIASTVGVDLDDAEEEAE